MSKDFFLQVNTDESKDNNTKCKSAFPCLLFLLQMEKILVGTAYNQTCFFHSILVQMSSRDEDFVCRGMQEVEPLRNQSVIFFKLSEWVH